MSQHPCGRSAGKDKLFIIDYQSTPLTALEAAILHRSGNRTGDDQRASIALAIYGNALFTLSDGSVGSPPLLRSYELPVFVGEGSTPTLYALGTPLTITVDGVNDQPTLRTIAASTCPSL